MFDLNVTRLAGGDMGYAGVISNSAEIRVCHLITGLGVGGAEHSLLQVCKGLARLGYHQKVLVMIPPGTVAVELERAGITVESLLMQRGRPALGGLLRLIRAIRRFQPHVLQTWMYHSDIAGVLARPFLPGVQLAWNLRNSKMAPDPEYLVRCLAVVSHIPDVVVANSEAGWSDHLRMGYRPRRAVCIPNGVDLERFRPNPRRRTDLRTALGIPVEGPVIGLIARYHPQKDHANFLDAAWLLRQRHPLARFVLAGFGCEAGREPLATMIRQRDLDASVILLGLRSDLPDVYPALDLVSLSSAFGEGTPNVLLEALACGIPCVATDVGDSRQVIGDCGRVVPARDPAALQSAWNDVLASDLAQASRGRAVDKYPEARVVAAYDSLYRDLCSSGLAKVASPTIA